MSRAIPVLLLFLCAACGTDLSDQPISQAEGRDLLRWLSDESFFTVAVEMRSFAGLDGSAPPAEPSGPYELDIDSSRFCGVEGTVSNAGIVAGTYDTAAETISGSGTVAQTFASCVRGNAHDQHDVEAQTDIAITHSIQLNEAVSSLTADLRLVGTFRWSALRDRSGTCTLDVQVLLSITGNQALQTLRGDFCDHTYDDTGTWVPLYGA
jgi:hypothetical protein